MPDKSWDLIYSAVMDLTKAVNQLRSDMNTEIQGLRDEMHAEIQSLRDEMHAHFNRIDDRLVNIESDLNHFKLKLFEQDKEIQYLKLRRA